MVWITQSFHASIGPRPRSSEVLWKRKNMRRKRKPHKKRLPISHFTTQGRLFVRTDSQDESLLANTFHSNKPSLETSPPDRKRKWQYRQSLAFLRNLSMWNSAASESRHFSRANKPHFRPVKVWRFGLGLWLQGEGRSLRMLFHVCFSDRGPIYRNKRGLR